ncbi:MAG: hypothetical protein R2849_01555 [Thermomicrobiales bacterium]
MTLAAERSQFDLRAGKVRTGRDQIETGPHLGQCHLGESLL